VSNIGTVQYLVTSQQCSAAKKTALPERGRSRAVKYHTGTFNLCVSATFGAVILKLSP